MIKLAWAFESEDLKHDFFQVEKIEQKMMQRYKELFDRVPEAWIRLSDNCAGQFKTQFCLNRLHTVPDNLGLECETINWCYFVPDHGKSLSDMLGSQYKIALEKGAAREKEFNARTVLEVAAIMTPTSPRRPSSSRK